MNKSEIRELAQVLLTVADQVEDIANGEDLLDVQDLRNTIGELRTQALRMHREIIADEVAIRELPNWAQRLLKIINVQDGDIVLVRYHNQNMVTMLAQRLHHKFPDTQFTVMAISNDNQIAMANEVELNALGWFRKESE